MGKKTHKVASEARAEILRRIKEEGIPVSHAAEEHGVTTTTIYKWLGSGTQSTPTWSGSPGSKKKKTTSCVLWAISPSGSQRPQKRIDERRQQNQIGRSSWHLTFTYLLCLTQGQERLGAQGKN